MARTRSEQVDTTSIDIAVKFIEEDYKAFSELPLHTSLIVVMEHALRLSAASKNLALIIDKYLTD